MAPQLIADRYHVERPIGRGGMGTVWLCRDQRLGRHVAVKQVGTLPGETTPDVARAMREARSSAALNHHNVVSIYDVVEEDDHIWLVLEYVPSRTLAEILRQDGPLPPDRAAWIGAQVAEGLAAAHAAGTTHRDVKPGNILVTTDDTAKISDFGIARAHGEHQLTRTGLVIGTPAYFSPELARGEDPTPAADVWALGATLYTAVEGHQPYQDQRNPIALLATIASSRPPRPQHAGFLTEPIGRMLDPDPRSRWSMVDAAHVLRRLHDRHAQQHTRESTAGFPAPRRAAPAAPLAAAAATGGAVESADDGSDDAAYATPDDDRRKPGGTLLIAGLLALVALAAVAGALLLLDGSPDRESTSTLDTPSASSPAAQPNRSGRRTRSQAVPSVTPTPTTSVPTPTPSAPDSTVAPTTAAPSTASPQSSRRASGADAEQFVRSYYAALPFDPQSAWSALSPSFQDQIGEYDDYRAFWSTISAVTVNDTTPAGDGAVDVSLTYTTDDGRVESEVRRVFLAREDTGYLIVDDAIVG